MRLVYIISIATILIVGCSKTAVTNRYQLMLSNSNKEIAQGERFSKMILRRSKLSKNREMVDMVNRVGKKISEVTNREYGTTNYNWKFYLIEDDNKINAFCLSGGKVFVYSGLLKYIKNDDELAVVMGHEIAHALTRHIAEKKSVSKISSAIKSVFDFMADLDRNSIPINRRLEHKLIKQDVNDFIILPHSRKQEYEADYIGLVLSSKAGYDPKFAIDFWNRFKKVSKVKVEYSSTHPTPEHRIEKIRKLITILSKSK